MKYATLIVIILLSGIDVCASSKSSVEKRDVAFEEMSVLPTWYPKEVTSTTDVDTVNKARENAYLEYMSQSENAEKPKTVVVGSGRGSVFRHTQYAANFYENKANDLLLIDIYTSISPDIFLDVRKISQLRSNTYDYVISEYAPPSFTYSPQAINGAINILKSGGKLILPFPCLIARSNWRKYLTEWTGGFKYFRKAPLELKNGDLFFYGAIHPGNQIITLLNGWYDELEKLCNALTLKKKLPYSDMFSSLSAIEFLPQKPIFELTTKELKTAQNAIADLIIDISRDEGSLSRTNYFYIAGIQYIEELLSSIVSDITDKASISLEPAIPFSDMWPKKEITDRYLIVITKK